MLHLAYREEGRHPDSCDSSSFPVHRATYHKDFEREAHMFLPCRAQDVGQVHCEVHDAPTCSRQVGSGEEGADEEALHDGHHSKHKQEDEHHTGVTVGQQVPKLRKK